MAITTPLHLHTPVSLDQSSNSLKEQASNSFESLKTIRTTPLKVVPPADCNLELLIDKTSFSCLSLGRKFKRNFLAPELVGLTPWLLDSKTLLVKTNRSLSTKNPRRSAITIIIPIIATAWETIFNFILYFQKIIAVFHFNLTMPVLNPSSFLNYSYSPTYKTSFLFIAYSASLSQ